MGFLVQLSQQECAIQIAENPPAYPQQLVKSAREYLANVSACRKQSLAVSSPEVDRAWTSGDEFWTEFLTAGGPLESGFGLSGDVHISQT
jgi:hypothetical protein